MAKWRGFLKICGTIEKRARGSVGNPKAREYTTSSVQMFAESPRYSSGVHKFMSFGGWELTRDASERSPASSDRSGMEDRSISLVDSRWCMTTNVCLDCTGSAAGVRAAATKTTSWITTNMKHRTRDGTTRSCPQRTHSPERKANGLSWK